MGKYTTLCMVCGSSDVKVIYEPKYSGLRGNCPECESSFPLS